MNLLFKILKFCNRNNEWDTNIWHTKITKIKKTEIKINENKKMTKAHKIKLKFIYIYSIVQKS